MILIDTIIETPKGSTQKYTYNEEGKYYELTKILPAGMVFPYDFGFIPGTRGEDGDPLDVIVISEFASFAGCRVKCRLVGCIEAMQTEHDQEKVRNDRYLAVPEASLMFSEIKSHNDLPAGILEQLEYFFIHYNSLAGKQFEPIKIIGPAEAMKLINDSRSSSS